MAPQPKSGGEGGVNQSQAEEGAGDRQHGGEAPPEARGRSVFYLRAFEGAFCF